MKLTPPQRTAIEDPCYLSCEALKSKFLHIAGTEEREAEHSTPTRAIHRICLTVDAGYEVSEFGGPVWHVSVQPGMSPDALNFRTIAKTLAKEALAGCGMKVDDEGKSVKIPMVWSSDGKTLRIFRRLTKFEAAKYQVELRDIRFTDEAKERAEAMKKITPEHFHAAIDAELS
jgi:hypothetical protein